MAKTAALTVVARTKAWASFTLIELLTVIALIAILLALTLAAASAVLNRASRSRATSEVQAMGTALERYKTDNGAYPVGNTTAGSGSVLTGPPSGTYPLDPVVANKANYQIASEALFQALTGQTNFSVGAIAGSPSYITFKPNQVGNITPATALSYVKDPWNNPYGYSTGDNQATQVLYPYTGTRFFDLWTTAGTTGSKTTDTNNWISNWTQ